MLQSLSSLQLQEPKWLSFRFHSIQPLSHSRDKSPFVRTPSLSRGTCFPFAFCRFSHSAALHFFNRISNSHLPLVSLRAIHSTSTVQPTASFSCPIQPPTKTCAKPLCILHRSPAVQFLPISVFHLRSTRSRLAAFYSASLHFFPLGIHSTCYPHSKKPMKISIIAKYFADEVIFS